MDQGHLKFFVPSNMQEERRSGIPLALPYLTDEGTVAVDRRIALDRRTESRKPVFPAILKRKKWPTHELKKLYGWHIRISLKINPNNKNFKIVSQIIQCDTGTRWIATAEHMKN